ncbi:MAG TPA: isocitrate lyase/PEP mutase family protein [Acidimicrobiales bacterium]|jgi:2-methylisocitrate lyase-like PEP mutase family enzyme|nr:isocitrate lyase/PEP mutase family protein [Acidimicrobiales bacterium]
MKTAGERLRDLLDRGRVVAPFVFDGLQARCAERAGFTAVYLTGFGAAAARALPDLGLLGMTDMATLAGIVASATSLPVVADADTGYGGVLNVARTVEAYERAGVAALHIEDQVWPKRCGFFEGKEVVPAPDMAAKIRAACAARRDPRMVVIGRTDALATDGWNEAERRSRLYHASGADLVFVDGIRTEADLAEYERRLGDLPLVYNGAAPTRERHDGLGVVLQLDGTSFAAVVAAVDDIFTTLAARGSRPRTADFAALRSLLGVDTALERAAAYERGVEA